MPQRCISLQSNFGLANPTGGTSMSPAFSPPRMRTATAAVWRLTSSTETSGPPTISLPKRKLVIRKNGCVGDGMKSCQRRVTFVHNTRRIDRHQLPENGRVRWKGGGVFEYVFERQSIVPSKCNPVF